MKKAFPCADLSNVLHFDYSSSENYFLNNFFRKITVDVCINGCMVYAGDYQYTEICLFCSEPRYSNTCIACHNQNIVGSCMHSNRRNKKTVEYRSIISLLQNLISSHPSFLDLLNYYDYGIKTDPKNLYFKDSKDGESYKRNMNEMKSNFKKYNEQRKNKTRKLVEVSLCLSWFYDGCQLYHHLIYSFLPLIFTILNLPPSFRNKLGIGTFLLTINTLQPGSYAEFFLIFDCFVQELLELFDGISFISDDNTEYFIQCRLICSILDLPALCKVFYFTSMFNSEEGCVLCNWGGGSYYKEIKKVKYANSRLNLPPRHYLRSIGFKICDCIPKKGMVISNCEDKKLCNLWDPRIKKWISLFDEDNTNKVSGYIWYNQDIADIDEIGINMKNEAVFKTQEYKLPLSYKRYQNEYYDCNATLAIRKKERAESKTQLKKASVNGIKGFSPLRSLPYIRYDSDICQDPAHVLFVNALMILNIWSCDKENYRIFKTGVKEYYKTFEFKNVFDCLWDSQIIIPWNFNKNEQLRVEAYLKCVLITQGSKSKFNIVKGNIFKQKGIIKGSGKVTLISVYMNLILFGNLHMSIGYRALFRIFSNVFSRIRNKKIFKADVIPLFKRCNELRSFWEGYIPITEMIQMLHALEDISMHFPNQGPIAGFNAMHGEQAIGFVKNLSHTKGSSRPELQALKNVAVIEFNTAKTFYSKLDTDRTLTDCQYLYWNNTSQSYVYNNERVLFDGFNDNIAMNQTEFSHLIETFHRLIISHYDFNLLEAFSNSSLFRIVHLYKMSQKQTNMIDYLRTLIHKYDSIVIDCNDNENRKYLRLKVLKIFKSLPIIDNKGIIESDINTMKQIVSFYEKNPVFTVYKRVLLPFSISLRGRGFEYDKNNKKNLDETFYKKDQFSSWCKIRLNETIEVDKRVKDYYGQANYFFQFQADFDESTFPDYAILKNIKFASVTTYTYDFHKIVNTSILKNLNQNDVLSHSHLNTINIINNSCINNKACNPSFITFDELLPTEVLTFAFIERGLSYKAIYPYHDFNSATLEEYVDNKQNFIISLNDETWQWKNNWYLAFIDGSPENIINRESASIVEDVEYENDFWEYEASNKYKYW